MAEHRSRPSDPGHAREDLIDPGPGPERIPLPQRLMDDVVLLLIAGLVVPTVLFIAWGLLSLGRVPDFAR